MCARMDFCMECAPTPEIVAYSEGRTHLVPTFGDGAQMSVAMQMRRDRFKELLRALDPSICDWPEYRKRYGYTGHLQRMIRLGRPILLSSKTMPGGLRIVLDQARDRMALQHGPRAMNGRYARREFKRVYCGWVKQNLAEAELGLVNRIVYGKKPALIEKQNLVQLFGIDTTTATDHVYVERELAVA